MRKRVTRLRVPDIMIRSAKEQKLIVMLCVLVLSLPALASNFLNVDFSEPDKQYHASGSFVGCETMMVLAGDNDYLRYVAAPVLMLSIGYAKEVTDERFNQKDINADLIGIGSAVIFDLIVHKWIFR